MSDNLSSSTSIYKSEGRVGFQLAPEKPYSSDSSSDETPNPAEELLLDPDHPLLKKFQVALKQYLQKQLTQLKNEVVELEAGAKKKIQEREELGVETYDAQQLVNRQQDDLEQCVVELQELCAETEQAENELELAKEDFNFKRLELLEVEKAEIHLDKEMGRFNLLMEKTNKWEDDIETEMRLNQRTFDKITQDHEKLGNEQRELDMIIYKLMTENSKFEEELATIDMQLQVMEEKKDRLAEAVTESNVQVETMDAEYRCLLHSWDSIIVAISQRDKHFIMVKSELDYLKDKVQLISKELAKTKKMCQSEMIQNEKLAVIKERLGEDKTNCKRLTDLELRKKATLEQQIGANTMIMERVEMDIKRTQADRVNKTTELELLSVEFDNINQQKFKLEENIALTLQEQLNNNKATKYLSRMLQEVKETNSNLEIALGKLENANAKVLLKIETMKSQNAKTEKLLVELRKQTDVAEDEIKKENENLKTASFQMRIKERDIELLDHQINGLVKQLAGGDKSPLEIKILNLERNIEETQEKIKGLQKFWLSHQGHVVGLCRQRQDQIHDIDFIKKQMLIIIQKNFKINDELESYKKQEDKMTRSINSVQNRLEVLNNELWKKKGYKNNISRSNDSVQSEYMSQLKDSELELLKIGSEISDIEEDKITLSAELIELSREALVWEKQIQMTVESRKTIQNAISQGGEMGMLKAEIHRMNINLSQLKKVQDKLVQELEHCISRRDAILTITEAREKRGNGEVDKTRLNFNRRLDDMRNKVKQLENEIEAMDKKMEFALAEEQRLTQEIEMTREEKATEQNKMQEVQTEIEESKTLKQKNLESLVLKQKKLKVFSELAKNRKPHIFYKSDSSIATEVEKHKEINKKMTFIVENLLKDFPNHLQTLQRIYNTLILPLKVL